MSAYTVCFHPDVDRHDLPRILANLRARVLRAIRSRLIVDPAHYGVRLRKALSGLWKIRVGDYRIVYEIRSRTVIVWAVRHRRNVYVEVARR